MDGWTLYDRLDERTSSTYCILHLRVPLPENFDIEFLVSASQDGNPQLPDGILVFPAGIHVLPAGIPVLPAVIPVFPAGIPVFPAGIPVLMPRIRCSRWFCCCHGYSEGGMSKAGDGLTPRSRRACEDRAGAGKEGKEKTREGSAGFAGE